MKNNLRLSVTLCLVCCFFVINCTPKANADSANTNQIRNIQSFKNDCREWNETNLELIDYQIEQLQTDGITTGKDGYLLSKKIVGDCHLGIEIGKYIDKVIGGRTDKNDEHFASEHSNEIVNVVRLTWNYYHDGASEEKYNLLEAKGLKDEDVAPLVAELLEKEGLALNPDQTLFYTLFVRRLPALNPTILEILRKAEKNNDYLNQFLALVLLYQNSPKTEYANKLKLIAENPILSKNTQKKVLKIVHKLETKQELNYDEIEEFQIAMFMQKPLSVSSNK